MTNMQALTPREAELLHAIMSNTKESRYGSEQHHLSRITALWSENSTFTATNFQKLLTKGYVISGNDGVTAGKYKITNLLSLATKRTSEKTLIRLFESIEEDGVSLNSLSERLSLSKDEILRSYKTLSNFGLVIPNKKTKLSLSKIGVLYRDEDGKSLLEHDLVSKENELYDPFIRLLGQKSSRYSSINEQEGDSIVEASAPYIIKTASGGKRMTGGQFTRPDVIKIEIVKSRFLPNKYVNLETYELKRYDDGIKISSAYEALAHSRAAHRSYLVIELPNKVTIDSLFLGDKGGEWLSTYEEICKIGVGLMFMVHTNKSRIEYDLLTFVEPLYRHPDPGMLARMLKYAYECNTDPGFRANFDGQPELP